MNFFSHLECSECGGRYGLDDLGGGCERCARPLRFVYDLELAAKEWPAPEAGGLGIWRYGPLLPPTGERGPVCLGEGMTPLLPAGKLGWIKDEAGNPGGSIHARAAALAVSLCGGAIRASGAEVGPAVAIYAAARGIRASIALPPSASDLAYVQCKAAGAEVKFTGAAASEALVEACLVEGAKTAVFEVVEQMGWEWPEALVYPDWLHPAVGKALAELERLGWVRGERPELVPVAPGGIRADMDGALLLARATGIFATPETGACIQAIRELGERRSIVVINTASGAHSAQVYARRFSRAIESDTDRLGGLITPR